MRKGENYIVVFITCANKREADKIAFDLVKHRLAACVNIVPDIKSIFWWQGKIDKAKELLLIVKSKKVLLERIVRQVKSLHSYTVPEVIALPISGGNKEYLDWLTEETTL